jgi:hypothetical protein
MSNYPIEENSKSFSTDQMAEYAGRLEKYIDWRRRRTAELNDKEIQPGEYKAEFVRLGEEMRKQAAALAFYKQAFERSQKEKKSMEDMYSNQVSETLRLSRENKKLAMQNNELLSSIDTITQLPQAKRQKPSQKPRKNVRSKHTNATKHAAQDRNEIEAVYL